MTFGRLDVIGSFDVGAAGPHESKTSVTLTVWPMLMPLFPALAILGLLLWTPNRSRQGWKILIAWVGAAPVALLVYFASDAGGQAGAHLLVPVGALCCAWLAAPLVARRSGAVGFLFAWLTAAGFAALAAACAGWGTSSIAEACLFQAVSASLTVGALGLARALCRRQWSALRFIGWTAVFVVVPPPVILLIWALAVCAASGWSGSTVGFLIGAPFSGMAAVFWFAFLVLPFLLVVTRVPLHRERLFALLHLPDPQRTAAPPAPPVA